MEERKNIRIMRVFIKLLSASQQSVCVLATKKNNFRAFTLIELMLVMAIISIMAALVISSFGDNQTRREVEAGAREFVSVVREAQNYALTGKQLEPNTTPCSFRVSGSGSSYTMTYRYKNSGTGPCSETSTIGYVLKNGVAFSSIDAVTFDLPHAGLDFSTGSKGATLSKSGLNHRVCIYPNGHITDQAGGTSCP